MDRLLRVEPEEPPDDCDEAADEHQLCFLTIPVILAVAVLAPGESS
jgi:hypothetical protein